MTRRISPAAIYFLLVLASLIATACSGPDVGKVSGRVTVNGKSLGTGHVVFSNQATGVSVNANINDDGTFVVKTYKHDGLPPGVYLVAVRSGSFGNEETALVGQRSAASQQPTVFIAQKYRNPNTSGFSATVQKGENPLFVFDLK